MNVNSSADPPEPPRDLRYQLLSSTSVLLQWTSAYNPNHIIVAYALHISELSTLGITIISTLPIHIQLLLSLGPSGRAARSQLKVANCFVPCGTEAILRVRCSMPQGSCRKRGGGDLAKLRLESGYTQHGEAPPIDAPHTLVISALTTSIGRELLPDF